MLAPEEPNVYGYGAYPKTAAKTLWSQLTINISSLRDWCLWLGTLLDNTNLGTVTQIILFPATHLAFEDAIELCDLHSCRALIFLVRIESVTDIGKYILQSSRQIIRRRNAQVELHLTQI